jgi:hypothetical protein
VLPMATSPPFTDPALRQRFVDYVTAVLPDLGRKDRQPWAEAYVRGLLLEGERKSIEPMAKRLPDGNIEVTPVWACPDNEAPEKGGGSERVISCKLTSTSR